MRAVQIVTFLATCGAIAVTSNVALADTYVLDETNLSGVNCSGATGCGLVTVSGSGTQYTIIVDLNPSSGLQLHVTGGGGTPRTVAFDLAGVTGIVSAATIVNNLATPTGNQDGFSTFLAGVDCGTISTGSLCATTGISPLNELAFTVTATAGQVLTPNSLGNFLSLDVATAAGPTGFVASNLVTFGVPGPIAGAGLPGLLAACFGLLALGRRRERA